MIRTLAAATALLACFWSPSSLASGGARIGLKQDERTTGYSGRLKVAFANPGQVLEHQLQLPPGGHTGLRYRWLPQLDTAGAASSEQTYSQGFEVPARTGVWRLEIQQQGVGRQTELVALVREPAQRVKNGRLNGYRIGTYPQPRSLGGGYTPPEGFLEVTEENQDLFVSEHFQLKHFLTKNQQDVWPKYLVLDLKLVDKLEAVTQKLHTLGFAGARLHVMSGYRTPQYNGGGGNGRARFSRHTYGDAGDVWVDADGDGYMDDLNGDGKQNAADAQYLASVVDRVEQELPELIGGAGIYRANRVHGPFVHIDARGRAARWSNLN